MEESKGLRERKKAATRLALHRAALELALRHGPDRITVESIADAVSVSRRTFSNYFSSKEEAIVYGDLLRLRRLLDLVRERPIEEAPYIALTQAVRRWIDEAEGFDPEWLAQRRMLGRHPSLLPHQAGVYALIERELATELERRLSEDDSRPLRARVLAAILLTALRVTTQMWMEQPDRPLAEMVDTTLDYLTACSLYHPHV